MVARLSSSFALAASATLSRINLRSDHFLLSRIRRTSSKFDSASGLRALWGKFEVNVWGAGCSSSAAWCKAPASGPLFNAWQFAFSLAGMGEAVATVVGVLLWLAVNAEWKPLRKQRIVPQALTPAIATLGVLTIVAATYALLPWTSHSPDVLGALLAHSKY